MKNTEILRIAVPMFLIGCGHSTSRGPIADSRDPAENDPRSKLALSEELEKAPTRNASRHMCNAFYLGVSSGQLDSLHFERGNANSFANIGCAGAAVGLMKAGKTFDLSFCEKLEEPRFREAKIPRQSYAEARLAIVEQFRGDPDAVTFQLLAFERGYMAATTDALRPPPRQVGFWIHEGCANALRSASEPSPERVCPELVAKILSGMADAKRERAAQPRR